MIVNGETKTSPKLRIAIIAIAILMLGSTFALYAGIVLNYGQTSQTNAANAEDESRYQELYQEYMALVGKQTEELSNKHFKTFVSYRDRVKSFNSADVLELKTKDLKEGTGKKVDSLDFVDYSAYYVGWLSDGTIFDSSFDNAKDPSELIAPLDGTPNMIQGWLEGIQGMKIGGIREITIPSVLAYGDVDQGSIPANSPLKFIVMLVDPVPEVDYEHLDELYELHAKLYGTLQ